MNQSQDLLSNPVWEAASKDAFRILESLSRMTEGHFNALAHSSASFSPLYSEVNRAVSLLERIVPGVIPKAMGEAWKGWGLLMKPPESQGGFLPVLKIGFLGDEEISAQVAFFFKSEENESSPLSFFGFRFESPSSAPAGVDSIHGYFHVQPIREIRGLKPRAGGGFTAVLPEGAEKGPTMPLPLCNIETEFHIVGLLLIVTVSVYGLRVYREFSDNIRVQLSAKGRDIMGQIESFFKK